MPIQTKNRFKKDSSSSRWNTRYCKLLLLKKAYIQERDWIELPTDMGSSKKWFRVLNLTRLH
jgi:hypothetical protein